MTDTLTWMRDFYWMHRLASWMAGGGLVVVLGQSLLALVIVRRLQELSLMRERMSRLADAMALLTDTTEAGLSTLMREVQQLSRRPGTRAGSGSSRNAVAKRVAAASRTGVDVATIATSESLSESEVRLHVKLAEAAHESAARGGDLRP